ncbi:MAG: anti-sigma factor domain-containing protein [Jatrophihabitans sp.]
MSDEPDRHSEWDATAVGYALSALEPGEQRSFRAHLESCERCQRTVAESSSIGSAIGTSGPVPEPAPELRNRVLSAAMSARPPVRTVASHAAPESDDSNIIPIDRKRRLGSVSGRWLLSAAAAVVVVALGLTLVSVIGDRNKEHSVATAREKAIQSLTNGSGVVIPLLGPDHSTMATVVAHQNTISVVSDAMPPNAANTTYVLWGMTGYGDTHPKAIAVFDVSKKGLFVRQVAADQRGDYTSFGAFAVSQEKGHDPPAVPSKVLAKGSR